MNGRFFTFSLAVLGIFAVVTGVGIWVTDESLMHLCRRQCWLNSLLYGLFGEYYGKLILGGIGCFIGLAFLGGCLHRVLGSLKKPGK
jgi:hypothetical protein